MQMTTLKAHRYGGKQRRPGDEYEVKAGDVRLVKAMGWARPADPVPQAPLIVPRMTLASLTAAEPAVEAPRQKRAYRRRDLTAEG